jgi:hypothetical protein
MAAEPHPRPDNPTALVQLYWIPLGLGASIVRTSGRSFEAIDAAIQRRRRRDLYHSVLVVTGDDGPYSVEVAPVPDDHGERRGAVAGGAVGAAWLGRLRIFRYEVRRWHHGVVPDLDGAVGGPIAVSSDPEVARRILELVPSVPTPVWGRDSLAAGEMWNSNSVTSWLLVSAGVDTARLGPPVGGRAPGWDAGRAVADRVGGGDQSNPSERSATAKRSRRDLPGQVGDVLHDLPAFISAPLRRRSHLRWGATDGEVAASMAGDDAIPGAQFNATRAISIDAPCDAVWPWLVQVGCLRAGWYSNDLLDNLGRPSATTILPAFQHLEVGQWVPMSPNAPTSRTALRVTSFEVDRRLLWSKPDSTWSWQLTSTDDGGTRLVTRIHARYDWHHPTTALLGLALMEFGDFAMIRRMLRGIKARAEAAPMSRSAFPVLAR